MNFGIIPYMLAIIVAVTLGITNIYLVGIVTAYHLTLGQGWLFLKLDALVIQKSILLKVNFRFRNSCVEGTVNRSLDKSAELIFIFLISQ